MRAIPGAVSPHFDVRVDLDADRAVLSLTGELDLAGRGQLVEALAEAEAAGCRQVVVDLRGLDYIDSSGIHALVEADERAQATSHSFAVVRGEGIAARVFELLDLDGRFSVLDRR